jgi:hypothetical protein
MSGARPGSGGLRGVSKPVAACLAASVVVGAVLRFRALGFGLPFTQARPDETLIIDVVLKFLRGDMHPRFIDYPWFYMYLSTVLHLVRFAWGSLTGVYADLSAYAASWPLNWPPFFLINRAVSATLGTLSILGVFAMGRRIGGSAVGAAGAFFMAVCFLPIRDSHYGTTDITMMFFIVLCMACLLRADEEGRARWFVWAGIAAGIAAGTKYNGLGLGLPILVTQGLVWFWKDRTPRFRWPMFGAGIPFLLVFLLCVPFVYLDFKMFREEALLLYRFLTLGQYIGPDIDLGNGWWRHLRLSLRYGMGLPLLLTGLAGLVVLAWRSPRKALIFLSFPVVYFGVAGASRTLFFRYTMAIMPFLCVTAALAMVTAIQFIIRERTRLSSALMVVAALALAAPSLQSAWQFDRVMSQTDSRVLAQDFIEASAPPGTSILQSGSRYGFAQFRRELHYRLWAWDGRRRTFMLDGRPADGRPDLILLQESPILSTTQPVVLDYLRSGYVFVKEFHAFSATERDNLYDIQDAFFVPYAGFHRVERPGPNFQLYRRADLEYPQVPIPPSRP